MRFKDRKIKTKLLMGFAVLLILMVVVGVSGLFQMGQIQSKSQDLYDNQLVPVTHLAQIRGGMLKVRATVLQHVIAEAADKMQQFEAQIKELDAQVDESISSFEQTSLSPEEKSGLAEFKQAWANFKEGRNNQTLRLSASKKKNEAMEAALGAVGQQFKKASDVIDTLFATKKKIAQANLASGNQQYAKSLWIVGLLLIGGIVLTLFLSIAFANTIAQPITKVVARVEQLRNLCVTNLGKGAEAMKQGDLKYEIITGTPFFESPAQDEIGQLEASLNGIIKQTQGTVASFEESRRSVLRLIDETGGLAVAVRDGQLQTRGEAQAFAGSYRDLLQNVNELVQGVAAPVADVSRALDQLAAQDLTARVNSAYKGDYDRLKNSLNQACEVLEQTLSQVSASAAQVNSAANEINSGSQSLAQGASEQASSLEEVSSSLQEMSSMIKQNAANAKEARGITEAARLSADKGVTSMQQLSEAVNRIKQSSDATAKIVKTIDEIAFQTNLLALNAAVEAARAGDAGKGFAVVAEEVRNLAMRSAEAAKNTAELIEGSVEGGVAINQEVRANLEEINRQVKQVSEVMAEIAAASDQQSQGVEQINAAITQMNQVTQQTAANAEESAAAAEELSGQSEEMLAMVGSFTLQQQHNVRQNGISRVAPAAAVRSEKIKMKTAFAGVRQTTARESHRSGQDLIPFDDADDTSALQSF